MKSESVVEGAEIIGVRFVGLRPNRDRRGSLTTIFLDSMPAGLQLVQWNLVSSGADVLRGMHAHVHYDEYYVPLSGRMLLALADVRPTSPTYRHQMALWLTGLRQACIVPHGVLHGVYMPEPSMLAYGLSSLYDGRGEFECRWDDPDLAIDWPTRSPMLSDRDREAGTYRELLRSFAAVYRT